MAADDKLAALEQLAKLKANGVITEAEFTREKAAVLAGRSTKSVAAPTAVHPPAVPPTAAYAPPPVRRRFRWGRYALVGLVIGLALEVPKYLPRGSAPALTLTELPTCDSADAKNLLTNALEHNAVERLVSVKVLDIATIKEQSSDPQQPTRSCTAEVTLNWGDERIGYSMRLNSDRTSVILQAYTTSILGNVMSAPLPIRDRQRGFQS